MLISVIASFFFFQLLGQPLQVQAQSTLAADQVIKEMVEHARRPDVAKNVRVQKQIESKINFKTMAKNVLLEHYNKVPSSDIDWFQNSLRDILALNVYPQAPDFLKNVSIKYGTLEVDLNKARLKSEVMVKGEVTEVAYQLEKNANNIESGWQVVDISIDDESWITNIQYQVQKALKKETWPAVKKKLNAKVIELKKKLADDKKTARKS